MGRCKTKQNNRWRFYSLLTVLLILVFVRYALRVNVPEIVLTVLAIIIACAGDRNEMIAVCMCCIPLYTSLQYYIVVGCSIVIYIVKYGRNLKITIAIIPILFFVLWELLHCFSEHFVVKSFIAVVVPYLMLCVVFFSNDKTDYAFVIRMFAVTTAAVCMILLGRLLVGNGFNFRIAFLNMQRLGQSSIEADIGFSGGEINPNTLGILCVIAISGILQLVMSGKKKTGDIVLMMWLLICGALTTSRTYLACLAIMLVLFIIAGRKKIADKLKVFAGVAFLVALAVAVLALAFPAVIETFVRRFNVEDVTSGRADLLVKYNRFIVSKPSILLFGIGLMGYSDKLAEYAVAGNVPHNGIQELIIAWGLPGLIMFLVLLLIFVWRGKQNGGKTSLVNYIPLLILLAKSQAGQMVTSSYTMLAFSLAYLSICHNFDENIDTQNNNSDGNNITLIIK